MEKMMSGMMKPEDMPHMIDSVFMEMLAKDRMAFMQKMMPRCMSMIFSELEPDARKDLAGSMLKGVSEELKSQLEE